MHWIVDPTLAIRTLLLAITPYRCKVQRNLVYKRLPGKNLKLDLFLPSDGPGPVPAVVFIHGGAWIFGTKRDYHGFARYFARAGVAGATPSFRLRPEEGVAGQIADIKDAIRWLRANSTSYGIDPDRIGIYGSSSGGHLAALAAVARDGTGFSDDGAGLSSAVQAACTLFGVYDFVNLDPNTMPALFVKVMRRLEKKDLRTDPAAFRPISPIHLVRGGEPPMLLMHGSGDRWIAPEQVARFAEALRAAGGTARCEFFEGYGHGFIKTRPWSRVRVFNLALRFFLDAL
jgi:acetyl esterase/lipase